VYGRYQYVRGGLIGELDDELRKISLEGPYALPFEMLVKLGLVARDGLDLDYFSGVVALGYPGDDAVGLFAVPRPVDVPPGPCHRFL
jgi:hypothetical protein